MGIISTDLYRIGLRGIQAEGFLNMGPGFWGLLMARSEEHPRVYGNYYYVNPTLSPNSSNFPKACTQLLDAWTLRMSFWSFRL